MSLPDGAEYWQSIRTSHDRYHSTHASVNHCHLKGGGISNDINDVDCHYCKALATNESKIEMLQKHENNLRNRARAEAKKKKKIKEKLINQWGLCECGEPRTRKMNKSTHELFLGCSSYPICKRTKPL